LPVTPETLEAEFEMTLPFWTYTRRISVSVPDWVPSLEMNWVMSENFLVVSMTKLEPAPRKPLSPMR
jgi:hypothetical protein